MIDNARALDRIESAWRSTPHCSTCGEFTAPVVHDDGSLWLECRSQVKPLLRRLLTLDFLVGHTRRQILDATT